MYKGHISIEEIEQLIQQKGPAENQTHVEACPQCKSLLEESQAVSAKLQKLASVRTRAGNAMNCPDPRVWFDVAAGTLSESESLQYIQHAADCHTCGQKLATATRMFAEELTPEEEKALAALPSSSVSAQRKLAERLANAPTASSPAIRAVPEKPKRSFWKPLSFSLAGAAVAVITALIGFQVYRSIEVRQTREEIAKRYEKGRPTEYRVAGVAFHSTPAIPRGDSESSYVAVPSWFHEPVLAAQAAFLERNWPVAADTLEKARKSGNDSPDVLDNLVVAYALEGERAQSQDLYKKALEVSDEIIRRYPSDSVVYFNRALIFEQIGRRQDAIRSLQKFVELESDPGWRAEANQKLQVF